MGSNHKLSKMLKFKTMTCSKNDLNCFSCSKIMSSVHTARQIKPLRTNATCDEIQGSSRKNARTHTRTRTHTYTHIHTHALPHTHTPRNTRITALTTARRAQSIGNPMPIKLSTRLCLCNSTCCVLLSFSARITCRDVSLYRDISLYRDMSSCRLPCVSPLLLTSFPKVSTSKNCKYNKCQKSRIRIKVIVAEKLGCVTRSKSTILPYFSAFQSFCVIYIDYITYL